MQLKMIDLNNQEIFGESAILRELAREVQAAFRVIYSERHQYKHVHWLVRALSDVKQLTFEVVG